jgi:hypothetical protein
VRTLGCSKPFVPVALALPGGTDSKPKTSLAASPPGTPLALRPASPRAPPSPRPAPLPPAGQAAGDLEQQLKRVAYLLESSRDAIAHLTSALVRCVGSLRARV